MKACLHCGERVVDEKEDFCCIGCRCAYKLINNLGFSSYYNLREIKDDERKIKPELDEQIDVSDFIVSEGEKHSLKLMIQGLHCAACVWLIENILRKEKDVLSARVNLSQKILHLTWIGEASRGNEMSALINKIGYKLLPFDEKVFDEIDKKYNNEVLKALAVAGFGAGNLMLLSISLWFSDSLDMGAQMRNLLHYFSALIAIPVVIYSGRIFFKSAFKSIKAGYPNMDLPISLAIILACVVSVFQVFSQAKHIYFDSAVMLTFFLLIGRYLDLKARKKAFAIAGEFALLSASFGRVLIDEKIVTLPIKKLQKGMILLVAAGEKIAADGVVFAGESEIDNSIINGESALTRAEKGSEVFASTINIAAPIQVLITKNEEESLLAKILEFVSESEIKKNSYHNLADKLAKIYTPLVHVLALFTFIFWLSVGFEVAALNAVAVLIITCPCALALAIPIVQTITISKFIKKGILVKSGDALEKISKIDKIIFDKTGTLTQGKLRFKALQSLTRSLSKNEEEKYLKIAASLAIKSRHPISKAIVLAFGGEVFAFEVLEKSGFGLAGESEFGCVKLGRRSFCEIKTNVDFSYLNLPHCFLKIGNEEFILLFEDKLKIDAKEVIAALQNMGKELVLLSGDVQNNVKNLAEKLTIKEFYFEQSPLQKAQYLQKLKDAGESFVMIGDGINDAPSLAFADVAISFSAGSDIAQNAADVVISNEKLNGILQLIKISKKSLKLMKQNLAISLIYNLVALPFAFLGFVLPLFAALSMSFSSLLVLLNSLRALKD
jgi:Cu2+-exporting ATPase